MVLLGAPSPTGANIPGSVIDDLSYLQQLYAINGGEVIGYFDALSAHPSGFSNPPDCTPVRQEPWVHSQARQNRIAQLEISTCAGSCSALSF